MSIAGRDSSVKNWFLIEILNIIHTYDIHTFSVCVCVYKVLTHILFHFDPYNNLMI